MWALGTLAFAAVMVILSCVINTIPEHANRGIAGAFFAILFFLLFHLLLQKYAEKSLNKKLTFFDLIVTSEDNCFSLSRFQIYIWTVWVVIAFCQVAFASPVPNTGPALPTMPNNLAVLMGISGFTAALSTAISSQATKIEFYFTEDEFTSGLSAGRLHAAIASAGYTLNIPASFTKDIDWLNYLLKVNNFYDEIEKQKSDQLSKSTCAQKLHNIYQQTNKIEDRIALNRCLLQEFFPEETPKSKRAFWPDFFRDIFLDNENTLDLPRTQMFIWTIVILIANIFEFLKGYQSGGYPSQLINVGDGLLILMGVSNGAYLGVKAAAEKKQA